MRREIITSLIAKEMNKIAPITGGWKPAKFLGYDKYGCAIYGPHTDGTISIITAKRQ